MFCSERSKIRVELRRGRVERFLWMRDEQEENKVRSPTRKSDVWATQIRLAIYRLGHPPTLGVCRILVDIGVIGAHEAAQGGGIVAGAEIVEAGFGVAFFAGERVGHGQDCIVPIGPLS